MDGIIYLDPDPEAPYKYHIVLNSNYFWYDINHDKLRNAAEREYSVKEYKLMPAMPNEFFF